MRFLQNPRSSLEKIPVGALGAMVALNRGSFARGIEVYNLSIPLNRDTHHVPNL